MTKEKKKQQGEETKKETNFTRWINSDFLLLSSPKKHKEFYGIHETNILGREKKLAESALLISKKKGETIEGRQTQKNLILPEFFVTWVTCTIPFLFIHAFQARKW